MEHECVCAKQNNADEFTTEQWKQVDEIIAKYREKPGSLIPVLEEVQGITGYLPESVQRRVSNGLNIPLSQVYGVVTFYSFFTMKPRGKHQIRLCLGTACHVRGAKRNLDLISNQLGIDPGECTEDREFSLDIVRCLGACGLAPIMTVDEEIHKQVKAAKVDQILKKYGNRSAGIKE
jgi:NADH:ubiquinone oxidoreductase subunit E